MNRIELNGKTYVEEKPTGTRAIVVVDRGWVFAGDVTRKNGRILLSRALHVRSWSKGFDSLPTTPKNAQLFPVSDVDIPENGEIFTVPVSENWGL